MRSKISELHKRIANLPNSEGKRKVTAKLAEIMNESCAHCHKPLDQWEKSINPSHEIDGPSSEIQGISGKRYCSTECAEEAGDTHYFGDDDYDENDEELDRLGL